VDAPGFTLLELIVVIVILMAMAALLTPVYLQSHAQAARQQCARHFSIVGRAMLAYAVDYDDSLPMARYDAAHGVTHSRFSLQAAEPKPVTWADLVLPYAGGFVVFACPADALDTPNVELDRGYPLSFAVNGYFYSQPGVERTTLTGGARSEIADAAQKILLSEAASRARREVMRPDGWKAPDGSAIWERHLGGANWVYADLHAQYRRMPVGWRTLPASDWQHPTPELIRAYPEWFPWVRARGSG
jgi:prepilin-type N-terminal cleavage/methylation domain-containing protein/prepilin-type processing-associated H-X9-DG protein